MPAALTPQKADFLAQIYARAADQYLISYLILTRFPESNSYALGFTLAHCMEISIKTAYFYVKKEPPPTGRDGHNLETLIKRLPDDLRDELEACLPEDSLRRRFEAEAKRMNEAIPTDMLRKFFDLNPRFDDDLWMMLYATFYSLDIKYGADGQLRVLQLMQAINPRLNKMGLRLIASARERFPHKELHRRTLAEFVDKLPRKYSIVAELRKFFETGKAEDTPAYMRGEAPPPLLLFDGAELDMLRQMFGLTAAPTP
jgi:hypothetical protein